METTCPITEGPAEDFQGLRYGLTHISSEKNYDSMTIGGSVLLIPEYWKRYERNIMESSGMVDRALELESGRPEFK